MIVIIILLIIAGIVTSIILFNKTNDIAGNQADERTDEEYISILLDNKEDFDYVAKIMTQWSWGYIYLDDNYLSNSQEVVIADHFTTNNQEMASEILNNEDFLRHLQNLYNLGEIKGVFCSKSSNGYIVTFNFYDFPKDFDGGLYYMENMIVGYQIFQIDEKWALWMIPNI